MTKREEWLAANPLRAYLKERSIRQTTAELTVSRWTFHCWLAGRKMPTFQNFEQITRLTGITYETMLTWWRSKPKERKKAEC